MSTPALFGRLREALEASGVSYMLTGSYASALHGTPRATQDIDIVIGPTSEQLTKLLDQFPEATYYVRREAAFVALAHRGQFNVIDFETGWKVDFIIVKARDFSRKELSRRRQLELDGVPLYVATAEDVLIAKLEWAKMGASARQLEDAAGIVPQAESSVCPARAKSSHRTIRRSLSASTSCMPELNSMRAAAALRRGLTARVGRR